MLEYVYTIFSGFGQNLPGVTLDSSDDEDVGAIPCQEQPDHSQDPGGPVAGIFANWIIDDSIERLHPFSPGWKRVCMHLSVSGASE